jgi:hypothetical protein
MRARTRGPCALTNAPAALGATRAVLADPAMQAAAEAAVDPKHLPLPPAAPAGRCLRVHRFLALAVGCYLLKAAFTAPLPYGADDAADEAGSAGAEQGAVRSGVGAVLDALVAAAVLSAVAALFGECARAFRARAQDSHGGAADSAPVAALDAHPGEASVTLKQGGKVYIALHDAPVVTTQRTPAQVYLARPATSSS